MHDKPLLILLAVCCLAVVVILATGIGGFAKGGEFNRKHGNRLMRWRLGAQFVAVILIVSFAYLRHRGGN